jgi:hypothetical protein
MSDDMNKYALMMDAYTEIKSELDASRQTKMMPAQPPLGQVLADFGPMPEEALFLGVHKDDCFRIDKPSPQPLSRRAGRGAFGRVASNRRKPPLIRGVQPNSG